EIHGRGRAGEVVRLERVLEVPAQLGAPALLDPEILLGGNLAPQQPGSGRDVPARVADLEVAPRPVAAGRNLGNLPAAAGPLEGVEVDNRRPIVLYESVRSAVVPLSEIISGCPNQIRTPAAFKRRIVVVWAVGKTERQRVS